MASKVRHRLVMNKRRLYEKITSARCDSKNNCDHWTGRMPCSRLKVSSSFSLALYWSAKVDITFLIYFTVSVPGPQIDEPHVPHHDLFAELDRRPWLFVQQELLQLIESIFDRDPQQVPPLVYSVRDCARQPLHLVRQFFEQKIATHFAGEYRFVGLLADGNQNVRGYSVIINKHTLVWWCFLLCLCFRRHG